MQWEKVIMKTKILELKIMFKNEKLDNIFVNNFHYFIEEKFIFFIQMQDMNFIFFRMKQKIIWKILKKDDLTIKDFEYQISSIFIY